MKQDRFAPLRRALLTSATRRLHLGVVFAGLALALVASAAGLGELLPSITLGLAVLAYGALVALDVTNPDYVRRASRLRVDDFDAEAWLNPRTLADPEIRQAYASILAALESCRRKYESSGEGLRASLEDGLRRSEQLVKVAGRAAKRSDAIRQHLDGDSEASLSAELERLRASSRRTADEDARRGYLQAADAKSKELETYRQLQGLRDRIHAQLQLIETSLDGLAAKLVKLDATDVAEAVSINDSITDHVKTMTTDVEILESSFEETFQELRL